MSYARNGVTLAVATLALTVGCNKSKQSASDSANGSVSSSSALAPDSSSLATPDSTALASNRLHGARGSNGVGCGTGHRAGGCPRQPKIVAGSSDAGILSTAADGDSAEVVIASLR